MKGALPQCPREGHTNSHVVFDGHYGKPGHKRQRYRCYPGGVGGSGHAFHRFVPALPRTLAAGGECGRCERVLGAHEGPQVPRWSLFPAHDIAESLLIVGRGLTYQTASYALREAADRWPPDAKGEPRKTFSGQLAADMVEVFAPVVYEEHRKFDWPEGTLVVDNLDFRVAAFRDDGTRIPKGHAAFSVLAAIGYENGSAKLWKMEAAPRANKPDWVGFFESLSSQPARIVSDGHDGIRLAAQQVLPDSDLYLSEWHIKESFRVRLKEAGFRDERAPIWGALEGCMTNAYLWEHFKVKAYRLRREVPRLWERVEHFEPIVLSQFSKRPREERWDSEQEKMVRERPRDWPRTTAGLERKLKVLRDHLRSRRYVLKNRERTNRLLMLMQLELNRQANVDSYSRAIRQWLESRPGMPQRRRSIEDPKGRPSLRD